MGHRPYTGWKKKGAPNGPRPPRHQVLHGERSNAPKWDTSTVRRATYDPEYDVDDWVRTSNRLSARGVGGTGVNFEYVMLPTGPVVNTSFVFAHIPATSMGTRTVAIDFLQSIHLHRKAVKGGVYTPRPDQENHPNKMEILAYLEARFRDNSPKNKPKLGGKRNVPYMHAVLRSAGAEFFFLAACKMLDGLVHVVEADLAAPRGKASARRRFMSAPSMSGAGFSLYACSDPVERVKYQINLAKAALIFYYKEMQYPYWMYPYLSEIGNVVLTTGGSLPHQMMTFPIAYSNSGVDAMQQSLDDILGSEAGLRSSAVYRRSWGAWHDGSYDF